MKNKFEILKTDGIKINHKLDAWQRFFLIFIVGLILPLLLIPLIKFTGYSEIVEEIAKELIVLFLILQLQTHKLQIFAGVVFLILFCLS